MSAPDADAAREWQLLREEEQGRIQAESRAVAARARAMEKRAAPVVRTEPLPPAAVLRGESDDDGFEVVKEDFTAAKRAEIEARKAGRALPEKTKEQLRAQFPVHVVGLLESDPLMKGVMDGAGVDLPELAGYEERMNNRKELLQSKEKDLIELREKALMHKRHLDGGLDVEKYVDEVRRASLVGNAADAGGDDDVDEAGDDSQYQFNYTTDEGEQWDTDQEAEAEAERRKGITVQNEASGFSALTPYALTRLRRQMSSGPANVQLALINNVPVKGEDLKRLVPNEWLNDEIVNAYMGLIKERSIRYDEEAAAAATAAEGGGNPANAKKRRPRSQTMASFFYAKLCELDRDGTPSYDYTRVRRWTRKFDVFSYDYMFVPINQGNVHWTLVVVNFRDKRMEYFDSMGASGPSVLRNMMRWLADEMNHKKGEVLDESQWETVSHGSSMPQQRNSDDCGMFLCKYADFLARGAEINFSAAHMNYFRARMAHELMSERLA